MKKIGLWVVSLLMIHAASAKDYKLWVFLSDKGQNVTQRLTQPTTFLSPTSIALKKQKGIAVTETDLPVWTPYLATLSNYECNILGHSRWLNAVAITVPENCWDEVKDLCFISGTKPIASMHVSRYENTADAHLAQYVDLAPTHQAGDVFEYGEGRFQAEQLHVTEMHEKGYTGRGVRVAVFDAGFDAVDTIDVFDSLWMQKRVITWWDFVDNDNEVFDSDNHGTNVLSCIAANLPGQMVGIAPHASFILARTEQSKGETNREEYNWVRAMEWADSIGVDIIHSSLGYYKFDDNVGTYKYEDMDGNTAISTKAADAAAKRGIIVTISAGNEGDGAWKHITAPSDADSVLCVGAVDRKGKRAGFSSIGPSADGQVKPDVMALGRSTTVATPYNEISTSDGTSFSGPIMAGFMILLKQSHKGRNNMDLIQATRLSGDQYNFPDPEYGYGIPNIMVADSLLKNVKNLATVKMPGTEKPVRAGAKPKSTPPPPIVYTTSPKSQISITNGMIALKVPNTGVSFRKVEIRMGSKRVILPAKSVTFTPMSVLLKTSALVPGKHYLHIETNEYEENFEFENK